MTSERDSSLITPLNLRNVISGGNSATVIHNAIEKFRHNSPAVPAERLYSAYRSLKEFIDSMGPDFASLSCHFNDIFLRILEERGESGSGIYRTVLRDSSEFRFLSGMFIKEKIPEPEKSPEPEAENEIPDEPPAVLTLKGVLADKKVPLAEYEEGQWRVLVEEHFAAVKDEKGIVKNSSSVLNSIIKRGDSQDYHVACVVKYLFSRLKGLKRADVSTKEYAMKLMNMVSDKSETWSGLHGDYLKIIRK